MFLRPTRARTKAACRLCGGRGVGGCPGLMYRIIAWWYGTMVGVGAGKGRDTCALSPRGALHHYIAPQVQCWGRQCSPISMTCVIQDQGCWRHGSICPTKQVRDTRPAGLHHAAPARLSYDADTALVRKHTAPTAWPCLVSRKSILVKRKTVQAAAADLQTAPRGSTHHRRHCTWCGSSLARRQRLNECMVLERGCIRPQPTTRSG